MPSPLSRIASIFPGFRANYAPGVLTQEERAARTLAATRADIDRSRARPRPRLDERVPTNYHGGIAGKVWFLPFADSATQDTPEIRAAMRLMRRDGYVKAAWEPQILTVASEDWQVQAYEPGNAESEEQADAFKCAIEEYLSGGIISVVRAICAPFGSDGHSLAEKVWGVAKKGRLAKKIVPVKLAARDTDPSTGDVRLIGDEFGNVTHVEARRRDRQPEYPITDFIFSRYMTVFDEPLGEAAFRPAYGPYWMRDTVRKLRVIHHEKKMAGMLVGTYQADDDKGPLEIALAKAKTATWMSIPEGTRVEAVALSTASEPDYRSFDESLRDEEVTAIAFAILQIIQGNVPDARGDTKTQKSMADLGPWLLMALVCDAVNHQFAPDFIDFNYPYPAGGGYPKLTFGAVSNPELLELLQVVTGAKQLGLKPSRKHYAKALSIQEADKNDPDDSMDDPNQTGALGGGGGGFPGGGFGGDPLGGAGQMFSESEPGWESFAWQAVPTEPGSKYKVKAVNAETKEERYGLEAKKVLEEQRTRAAEEKALSPIQKGALKAANAVNKGAGWIAKAPVKTGLGAVHLAGAAFGTVPRVLFGALARVAGRDTWLGYVPKKIARLGKLVEREAKLRITRLRAVDAGMGQGYAAGKKEALVRGAEEAFVHTYRKNRRIHGTPVAAAMGTVYLGVKLLGLVGKVPGVGRFLAPLVSFGKEFVGTIGTPLLNTAMNAPLKQLYRSRLGRVAGLMKTKRNPDAAGRIAERLERGKAARVPPEKRERVAEILSTTAKGRAVLARGFAERFAEQQAGVSAERVLLDLREQLDDLAAAAGQPPLAASDEELGEALAAILNQILDTVGDPPSRERFSWQPARSRDGGIKAVGTGDDAGKGPLYGDDAERALADAGASRPTDLKEDSGARAREASAVFDRAGRGDAGALKEAGGYARKAADTWSGELARTPALDGSAVRSRWQGPAELGTQVEALATEREPSKLKSAFGGIVSWLGRQTGAAAVGAVEALARLAWSLVGPPLTALGRAVEPAAWYVGGLAATAAIVALPAVAVAAGLIPWAAGLLAAPAAVKVGLIAGKVARRKGAEAVGRNFYPTEYGSGTGRKGSAWEGNPYTGHAELADRFGEGAGNLLGLAFESFSWDDWKQVDGGKWKSPGGRYLSDAAYQQLRGAGGGDQPGKAQPGAEAAPARPVGAAGASGKFAPPKAPQPGRVYQVDPRAIVADPGRFQFKLNTDAKGVTKELQSVGTFDPDLAGAIAVWRDPVSGKTNVVNGHHRLDLAVRTGTRAVAVRYLSAATAEEARAKGALINIAEGRGTAVDAAKFLRDSGRSAEDLAAVGVSLKGQIARDAVELAKLSPVLFRRVTFGAVEPDRAVAVARHLSDHGAQEQLVAAVEKQEERAGRPVSAKVVEAMAQEYASAPTRGKVTETLFGPIEEDESIYFHRAELKSYIRTELVKEARDFRLGASARRAEALKGVAGNALATDENRKVADKADANLAIFDGQARLKGALGDLLNDYAVEYANASNAGRAALRTKALAAVRGLLSGTAPGPVERVERGGPGLFGEG